jgi:hypothetical protein
MFVRACQDRQTRADESKPLARMKPLKEGRRLYGSVMICPCLLQFGRSFRRWNDSVWRMTGSNEDPGSGAGKKANKHKTIHRKRPHVRSEMHEAFSGMLCRFR